MSGNYQVGVRVANACDAGGSPGVKFTSVNNCFAFTVSPNPATEAATISVTQPADTLNLSSKNVRQNKGPINKIYKIEVEDSYGNILKNYTYKAGITTTLLNLSGLRNGIYLIKAHNGNIWEVRKIVIGK